MPAFDSDRNPHEWIQTPVSFYRWRKWGLEKPEIRLIQIVSNAKASEERLFPLSCIWEHLTRQAGHNGMEGEPTAPDIPVPVLFLL